MKLFVLLITILAPDMQALQLDRMRKLFVQASLNESAATQLKSEAHSLQGNISKGYQGAARMIMARFYISPITKLNSFREGKSLLETAIHTDPASAELRYIRLVIQKNAPAFLGYNKNIVEDINFLRSTLESLNDHQLKQLILNTL